MATQSQGIRQLMASEKEAATVVTNARKKKNLRLKEAKEEAQKEIEAYRKQRETQFQEQQKKHAGSKDDFSQKSQRDTQEKLVQLSTDVDLHKDKVMARLMELVYDIKPELHVNARLNKNL